MCSREGSETKLFLESDFRSSRALGNESVRSSYLLGVSATTLRGTRFLKSFFSAMSQSSSPECFYCHNTGRPLDCCERCEKVGICLVCSFGMDTILCQCCYIDTLREKRKTPEPAPTVLDITMEFIEKNCTEAQKKELDKQLHDNGVCATFPTNRYCKCKKP